MGILCPWCSLETVTVSGNSVLTPHLSSARGHAVQWDGRLWDIGLLLLPALLELSHEAFLHVGDLQAAVSLQAAVFGPALQVFIPTVLILKRAIVIMEVGLFAAEAPSYLPQGQLRRQKQTRGQRKREMRTGSCCGNSSVNAV